MSSGNKRKRKSDEIESDSEEGELPDDDEDEEYEEVANDDPPAPDAEEDDLDTDYVCNLIPAADNQNPPDDTSMAQYDSVSSESDDQNDDQTEDQNEFNPDEIDDLLEEGLPKDYQRKYKPKYSVKEIVVIEEKGKNTLEALPEGWLEVRHSSGIPVYLHRKSRVCTLAKPYALGPSSVRKHLLPLSGIPCLSYKRALEREENQAKEEEMKAAQVEKNVESSSDGVSITNADPKFVPLPSAKVETAEETNTLFTIQPDELKQYCQKLFKFQTIQCKRFKNWNAKRKHTKMQKRLKVQRPTLPDGVKLIKFPVKPLGNGDGSGRPAREYVLNPKGKSSVCILHEYVQHALRQQPVYQFKELEHASTPYSATVLINNIQYGSGFGTSKKQAKSNAARETLEVLIPQIKDTLQTPEKRSHELNKSDVGYAECFDGIKLDDKRIASLCQNISEPTPYSLLLTCIQRNYGKMSEGGLTFEIVSTLPNQKIKFRMSFKEHIVETEASNKKEGKQIASQMLLAKIHPHIDNFGAFIRLYGMDSIKSCKEKKQDQQEVTELQSKASINSPNFAILAKLREEMRKLYQESTTTTKIAPGSDTLELSNLDK